MVRLLIWPFSKKVTWFVLFYSLRFTHKMQLICLHNEGLAESHFQYHLSIRVIFIICKFVFPKRPFDFGLQTRFQFARCIFLVLISASSKRISSNSINFLNHPFYMDRNESTTFINTSLLAIDRELVEEYDNLA
jgi:hypothetical protein